MSSNWIPSFLLGVELGVVYRKEAAVGWRISSIKRQQRIYHVLAFQSVSCIILPYAFMRQGIHVSAQRHCPRTPGGWAAVFQFIGLA